MEKLEFIRLVNALATQWDVKQVKAKKAENKIINALIEDGYMVKENHMKEEGEISVTRKRKKLKEPRFPDATAICASESCSFGDYFFLDAKYKGSSAYLGIVNVNDYDGYFAFLRYGHIQVPFKIFFYLHDVKQIWFHNLRDPCAKPNLESTIEIMGHPPKPAYRIPHSELEFWKRVYAEGINLEGA